LGKRHHRRNRPGQWVQAKGFKDPARLAQSTLNLEKLTGDLNSVVRIPKDDDARP
jgi:hypothetical protein